MRKIIYRVNRLLFLSAIILFVSSCNRSKMIPDDDLGDIFRDIYIANAYHNIHHPTADTIEIYTLVLDNYGYDIDDFHTTMLGFAKRKNSKLSLIIEDAIRQIDTRYYSIESDIATLDTIAIRSKRWLQDVLIDNQRIEINSVADTAKLIIELDAKEGSYLISYISAVDSLDRNKSHQGTHSIKDSLGNNLHFDSNWFGDKRRRYSKEIVADLGAAKLVLNLGNYGDNMKKPALVIDSLRIVYHLPSEVAVDSILSIFTYNLYFNEAKWLQSSQDSVPLRISPPWIISEGGYNYK